MIFIDMCELDYMHNLMNEIAHLATCMHPPAAATATATADIYRWWRWRARDGLNAVASAHSSHISSPHL